MTRRRLLALLAAIASARPHNGAAQPPAGHIPAIDTHTHFYDPTRPHGVPWPPPDDRLLHRPHLPQEFTPMAAAVGVVATVVVEASPWLEDNQWLLDLADEHPELVGVVGNLVSRNSESLHKSRSAAPGRQGAAGPPSRATCDASAKRASHWICSAAPPCWATW